MPLRLTTGRTLENLLMINEATARFLTANFRPANRAAANRTILMSSRTGASAPHPKILRILSVLVQTNLVAPQKTD